MINKKPNTTNKRTHRKSVRSSRKTAAKNELAKAQLKAVLPAQEGLWMSTLAASYVGKFISSKDEALNKTTHRVREAELT